jgi:sulfite dehydrogenase (quinone) subunit SoeC
MNPAWSVIFLTTLIGAGQGLFIALYAIEIAARFNAIAPIPPEFFAAGSIVAVAFLLAGLAASFFHLGRPARAWRAVAMWRTSWLSREVIVLPAFIAAVFCYGAEHYFIREDGVLVGALAFALCMVLFFCTGMIYACLKFLQEWRTPLTLINFFVLGTASGLLLATVLAACLWPALTAVLAAAALMATAIAAVTRAMTLVRNARLRLTSTLQTAIGIANPKIAQKAQGAMGGSFNTREFFHGRTVTSVRMVKWVFLLCAFVLPIFMIGFALTGAPPYWLAAAFVVQYAGLLAERWFFFAQARHPQNLYYQAIS